MPKRNLTNKFGIPLPAVPVVAEDSDGDDDFDPISNRQNKNFSYEGLEISSHSESDKESIVNEDNDSNNEIDCGVIKKKDKKKSKKKKNKAAAVLNYDQVTAGTSGTSGSSLGQANQNLHRKRPILAELDEIDRSLMEVNALLGEPPPAAPAPEVDIVYEEMKSVLGVQLKYLNVCNELKKLFGPEEPEDIRIRAKTQPHRARLLKRVKVQPTSETPIYNFKKAGLSMSILNRDNDVTAFVYDHDSHYQKMHSEFLQKYIQSYMRTGPSLSNFDNLKRDMHVEPLLDICDFLFRMDENGVANEIVENIVTYLQFCAHPSFDLTSLKVRLSYHYLENRPFHVAMLKYAYLLSNKACHRTALEIVKMLLNVDPCDPLATVLVIDTFALRAREHEWLIEAVEYFKKNRQAGLLFNFQYSNALAHFHVALKNKLDVEKSDRLLQSAVFAYPGVVINIFELAKIKENKVLSHVLFHGEAKSKVTEGLSELMLLYAKLTWQRWREPKVIDWFVRNVNKAVDTYDSMEAIRQNSAHLAKIRQSLFEVWPNEILRHVLVIRNMANLLMDAPLENINRRNSGWDPLCDEYINRYNYSMPTDRRPVTYTSGQALLYRFFSSIIPVNDAEAPFEDE